MAYRMLGNSGLKVSPLCMGTMNFGNETWGCDEKTSLAILEAYVERGGNFIDTANRYAAGRSEEIVGKFAKGRREDLVVATKGFFPEPGGTNRMGSTRKNLRSQLEISLKRLDTDYIDLYQVHMWDPLTPVEETLGVLSDLVHEGKVHYVGCCNFTGWQLVSALERAEQNGFERFISTQPQYSLICRDIELDLLPAVEDYGVGVMAWSPLAFGMLAGKYDRSGRGPSGARLTDPDDDDIMKPWKERIFHDKSFEIIETVAAVASELETTPVAVALSWLLEQPPVTSVILGPRSVEQFEGNWAALELELPLESLDRLDDVSAPPETYLDFMQGSVTRRRIEDLQ